MQTELWNLTDKEIIESEEGVYIAIESIGDGASGKINIAFHAVTDIYTKPEDPTQVDMDETYVSGYPNYEIEIAKTRIPELIRILEAMQRS